MNQIPEPVREELAALAKMSDEDISYADIPSTKDEDWASAVRGKFYRLTHSTNAKRVDADTRAWLH